MYCKVLPAAPACFPSVAPDAIDFFESFASDAINCVVVSPVDLDAVAGLLVGSGNGIQGSGGSIAVASGEGTSVTSGKVVMLTAASSPVGKKEAAQPAEKELDDDEVCVLPVLCLCLLVVVSLVLSCLFVTCLVVSRLVGTLLFVSCLIVSCLIVSHLVVSCLVVVLCLTCCISPLVVVLLSCLARVSSWRLTLRISSSFDVSSLRVASCRVVLRSVSSGPVLWMKGTCLPALK